MEKKIIPLPPTTKSMFFRQYLELLNTIIHLRGKELDVLAELLYYNHDFKNIPEEHRWKIIFDYDTKLKIRNKLSLSEASMNNNLSALRKKNIIQNNKITKAYIVEPKKEFVLAFSFKIDA